MTVRARLSITLSGGAALGAYQAGAVAALSVAVRRCLDRGDETLRVEAVGGASAGALVAIFSAYGLARGLDPVALLHAAWVEEVSLGLLRSDGGLAPLDFEEMRRGMRDTLGATGDARFEPEGPRHPWPVAVHVALTGLHGLTYPIRALRNDRHLRGVTYADWDRFVLEPGCEPDTLFEPEGASPLDLVLASAANPGAFAPRLLDRSDDVVEYRARGIENLPDHAKLWFTDGGLVQTEPLGRVLEAGRQVAGPPDDPGVRRINVVVDPRSEGPSGSGRWSDPDARPGWLEGLSRALAILPAQIIYEDLRRIQKRNTRIEWADTLVEALAPHLDADASAGLDRVLDSIQEDLDDIGTASGGDGGPDPDAAAGADRPGDAATKLRHALDRIAGLAGKEPVDVDVISPLLLADEQDEDVPGLLAGEFLGDFGGFLRQELRHSDFCLGYESAAVWMESALADVLGRESLDDALDHVRRRSPGDWREVNRGAAGLDSLPWRARLSLARYGLHMARVALSAALGLGGRRDPEAAE